MGNAAQQGDIGCTRQDQVSRDIFCHEIEERKKKAKNGRGAEWGG